MLTLWRTPLRSGLLRAILIFGRTCIKRSRTVVFDSWLALHAPTLATLHSLALVTLTIKGSVRLAIAWSSPNLEFVQLVPLLVGAIPFRDGHEFANPAAQIKWLRIIIHTSIMNHRTGRVQQTK